MNDRPSTATERDDAMEQQPTPASREVTIVVTPRERFGLAEESLDSIYRHTTPPFDLVYVNGGGPRSLRRRLVELAAERGFELVQRPEHLSPNQARNLGLELVDTPYVVFVDNDLIVTDGWLDRLIDCAEETGAAVVGPLYFEGEPADRTIHMAGGDYALEGEPGRRTFSTVHRFQGEPLGSVPALSREPVDFVEFHCLLARTEIVRELGGLDEAFLSSREHLDLCLAVAESGGTVYFEPSSQVTYRTPPPVDLVDIPFYVRRWSEAWNEASLAHFCDKYGIDPSYGDRIVGMRARRQILLQPLLRTTDRILPNPVDRFVTRVVARSERELNRALVRRP